MAQDLRTFLEQVRSGSPEEYEVVEREIDPKFEITALTEKLDAARRRPILELRGVKGTDFTVVTNVFAKRSRLAFDELLANQLALALVRINLRRANGRAIDGDGRFYQSQQLLHGPMPQSIASAFSVARIRDSVRQ